MKQTAHRVRLVFADYARPRTAYINACVCISVVRLVDNFFSIADEGVSVQYCQFCCLRRTCVSLVHVCFADVPSSTTALAKPFAAPRLTPNPNPGPTPNNISRTCSTAPLGSEDDPSSSLVEELMRTSRKRRAEAEVDAVFSDCAHVSSDAPNLEGEPERCRLQLEVTPDLSVELACVLYVLHKKDANSACVCRSVALVVETGNVRRVQK